MMSCVGVPLEHLLFFDKLKENLLGKVVMVLADTSLNFDPISNLGISLLNTANRFCQQESYPSNAFSDEVFYAVSA